MAIVRMHEIADATWSRAWAIDTTAEFTAFLLTYGAPFGPKRGDVIFDIEANRSYLVINANQAAQISNLAEAPIDLTSSVSGILPIANGGTGSSAFYSTGNWTPVIGGAGGTSGQAYSAQEGWYVKLGRMVYVGFNVQLSTKGTITGNVQIQGLPFPSAATPPAENAYCTTGFNSLVNNTIAITGFQLINTSIIALFAQTAAATASFGTPVVTADLNNTSHFAGTCIYRAAS